MMRFLREPANSAVQPVCNYIVNHLHAGKSVLWLLTGGSAIATEAAMMAHLRDQAGDMLKNLVILLGDDRYGKPGHENSNYQLLKEAGFDSGDATWHDVLEKNLPFDQTIDYYSDLVRDAQTAADVTIALFGIGPDAHIAGIKPNSPATSEDMASVVGYEWDDFTRLTMTTRELTKSDVAFVLAYGRAKRDALERLHIGLEPVREVPCNLLHRISDVEIYNDQLSSEET